MNTMNKEMNETRKDTNESRFNFRKSLKCFTAILLVAAAVASFGTSLADGHITESEIVFDDGSRLHTTSVAIEEAEEADAMLDGLFTKAASESICGPHSRVAARPAAGLSMQDDPFTESVFEFENGSHLFTTSASF